VVKFREGNWPFGDAFPQKPHPSNQMACTLLMFLESCYYQRAHIVVLWILHCIIQSYLKFLVSGVSDLRYL